MTGRVLRVLVVDDEALARQVAVEYLGRCADVEVAGECANGYEAVKAVSDAMPDVLLLDVQMPKLSGFDVLELVGPGPAVIFATAHDEFALKAFEVHAVDYLLKPYSEARLVAALDRARERLAARAAQPADQLRTALRAVRITRVLVRDGAKVFVVPVDAVEHVQAQDDYVLIHAQGRNLLKEQPISSLEAQLDPDRFVRIHRSWLINLAHLDRVELEAKDRRVAILRDGTRLPVSRTGHQRLQAALGQG
ncbi:DNA-binding response regulator [Luteitalea sp. TBR-22]|uniref:LytR/AlgR family response regulator transcription factor n=1 Tax=Luteitalea sp. TBR-22 TaxID=2802971 RepID=UPI001AF64F41|nr:LytTR family DNA-binding domain-containing protein [Luteitalea sp. TBR-22]BCS33460.1 DNA-binding response regulator [Luteitalea sp. TBR-22]